ncbi:MAG: hypothetical protein HY784_15340 [Chloroflexi bacterium]|nr:hypothetical protein [Chloroflexota bacterium]
MLWFDDDGGRSLEEKVRRAAEHYARKYGQRPTLCFVNPGALNGGPHSVAGVQLRKTRTVMLNHFWIGYEEPAAGKARR